MGIDMGVSLQAIARQLTAHRRVLSPTSELGKIRACDLPPSRLTSLQPAAKTAGRGRRCGMSADSFLLRVERDSLPGR